MLPELSSLSLPGPGTLFCGRSPGFSRVKQTSSLRVTTEHFSFKSSSWLSSWDATALYLHWLTPQCPREGRTLWTRNTRAGFAGPQLVHAASPEEGTILTYTTAEAANLGLPLPTWLQKQINLAKHGHSQNCLLKLKSCQRARKNLKCITLMSHLPSCTNSPRWKHFDLSDWKAFPPLEISPLYKFTKPTTEKYDFLSVLSALFHSLDI